MLNEGNEKQVRELLALAGEIQSTRETSPEYTYAPSNLLPSEFDLEGIQELYSATGTPLEYITKAVKLKTLRDQNPLYQELKEVGTRGTNYFFGGFYAALTSPLTLALTISATEDPFLAAAATMLQVIGSSGLYCESLKASKRAGVLSQKIEDLEKQVLMEE